MHAENEAYEDKIVKECKVLGVAVKILKDLCKKLLTLAFFCVIIEIAFE